MNRGAHIEEPRTGSARRRPRRSLGSAGNRTPPQPLVPTPAGLQALPWWSSAPSPSAPRPLPRGWRWRRGGRGLAGASSTDWRQGQVAAGVGDGSGVWERGRATSPAGSWGAGRLGRGPRVPTRSAFGFRAGSERSSPARLAGPEGGRGQGRATGDRDTGTLIC